MKFSFVFTYYLKSASGFVIKSCKVSWHWSSTGKSNASVAPYYDE